MSKGLAIAGLILLTLLVIMQGYSLYEDLRAARIRATRAEEALVLMEQQQDAIASVLEEYRAAAYSDRADRIAEQQLIVAEYQLQVLQMLALQNGEIMGLLYAGQ